MKYRLIGRNIQDTYRRMKSDQSEAEDKNKSHHNKECVQPAVMSRWCKEMEKKSIEGKCSHITYKCNNKQRYVPKQMIQDMQILEPKERKN